MGRKVFVSYKYGDDSVYGRDTTVRDYVDELQDLLDEEDHVNKGEADDTDLSELEDDTIRQKLAARVFDSTVTIVIISPNMKELGPERDQWIPWEVSYSLRTERHETGNSNPNAMIAVVLPDVNNSYEYYIEEQDCSNCGGIRTLNTGTLFPILKKNMFNVKEPEYVDCDAHKPETIYVGESSYIKSVKWSDFEDDPNKYIEAALERQRNRNNYDIKVKLEK